MPNYNSAKIDTFKASAGNQDAYAKPGNILGVYLVVSGTNEAGQVGTAADIGRFLVTRGEDQRHNADFNDFKRIMDTRSGKGILESTDGGAFIASTFIPFFEEGFPNTINVTGKRELLIQYQPNTSQIETVFVGDELTVQVVARYAQYPERYPYRINSKILKYNGATKADTEQLPGRNLTALFIDDSDDILDLFQMDNNKGSVQGPVSYDVLRAQTLQENQIEDETFDFPKITTYTPGAFGTTRNSGNNVTVSTSGAGDIRLILCSISGGGNGN